MELWIARDADGSLWCFFRGTPVWRKRLGQFIGEKYFSMPREEFPLLKPGHKLRVRLVPDGEPVKGGE